MYNMLHVDCPRLQKRGGASIKVWLAQCIPAGLHRVSTYENYQVPIENTLYFTKGVITSYFVDVK